MLQALSKAGLTSNTSYNPDKVIYVPGQQRPMNVCTWFLTSVRFRHVVKIAYTYRNNLQNQIWFCCFLCPSTAAVFSKPWHNFIPWFTALSTQAYQQAGKCMLQRLHLQMPIIRITSFPSIICLQYRWLNSRLAKAFPQLQMKGQQYLFLF